MNNEQYMTTLSQEYYRKSWSKLQNLQVPHWQSSFSQGDQFLQVYGG